MGTFRRETKMNKHEPAFPSEITVMSSEGVEIIKCSGLTKREYFACAAMQGMCALTHLAEGKIIPVQEIAKEAVEMADALLAELSKEQSEPGKEK